MTPLFSATKGGRKWLDDVEKAPRKSPFLVKASADDEGVENDAEAVRENALKKTADDAKTSSVAHLKTHKSENESGSEKAPHRPGMTRPGMTCPGQTPPRPRGPLGGPRRRGEGPATSGRRRRRYNSSNPSPSRHDSCLP